MAQKKKRTKKYNPIDKLVKANERIFQNLFLVYSGGDDIKLINRDYNEVPITETMMKSIANVRYKWSVYLAGLGRDQDDKPYTKSEQIFIKNPHFHHEINDVLHDRHWQIVKNFNDKHFIGAGWIASPVSKEISEEQAFAIFEKAGVWT